MRFRRIAAVAAGLVVAGAAVWTLLWQFSPDSPSVPAANGGVGDPPILPPVVTTAAATPFPALTPIPAIPVSPAVPAPTPTPAVTLAFTVPPQSPPPPELTLINTGAGTEFISPALMALLHKYVADPADSPSAVRLRILHYPGVRTAVPLADHIQDAGGTGVGEGVWEMPTGLVLSVLQRPDVVRVWLLPERGLHYPNMNDTLAHVVAAHQAGAPERQAALYALAVRGNRVAVAIDSPDLATEEAILGWLSRRGVWAPSHHPSVQREAPYYSAAMVPVAWVLGLAAEFPGATFRAEDYQGHSLPMVRSRWPQGARDYEDKLVQGLLESER